MFPLIGGVGALLTDNLICFVVTAETSTCIKTNHSKAYSRLNKQLSGSTMTSSSQSRTSWNYNRWSDRNTDFLISYKILICTIMQLILIAASKCFSILSIIIWKRSQPCHMVTILILTRNYGIVVGDERLELPTSSV